MSKRVLLLLIATYIISLLFGLLTPQYREVKALQLDLLKKSTTLNTHVHYVARLNAVLDTLDTKEDLMLRVNQALPSEPNTSALLEFLDVATAQSGVILVDVGGISGALVGDEGGRVIRESKLSLEVSGNYRSFLDLIRTLERSTYIIEVDSVSFADEGGGGFYDFVIVLRTRHTSMEEI